MRIKVRRKKNKDLKEILDKKNKEIVLRRAEFVEETWLHLVDRFGHLRCWATATEIQRWVLEKGYIILEAEGLDEWFAAQKKNNTWRYQDMSMLRTYVNQEVTRNKQLESLQAKIPGKSKNESFATA